MNYFRDANPTSSGPLSAPVHHRLRNRAAGALAVLGLATVIAGCGSSGETGTITIGNENKADNALIKAEPTVKTPTTGPLSEEPKITVPKEPAPTKLVTKEIIKGTGKEADPGSTVYVNYVGALYKNGSIFDASWKRKETFTFKINSKDVIPGWERGILGMKEGGRRELIIPPELGYGKAGSPPKIPGNEALIFIVDLLKAEKLPT